MANLADTQNIIQDALSRAVNPICIWSGDARSQLLLSLIREKTDVPILVFKDWWDDLSFVTKMVAEQKLTVYFYRPLQMDYKDGVITSYYNLAQKVLPITTTVVKSNQCGLDWGRRVMKPTPIPHYIWDVTFAGSKASDTHQNLQLVTPLADWTDEEVAQAAGEFVSLDTWHGCMACQDTQNMVWCPKENRMIQGI